MIIQLYVNGNRGTSYQAGSDNGLSEEACDKFRFAAEEHLITYEVDEDGTARAIALDGRKLNDS